MKKVLLVSLSVVLTGAAALTTGTASANPAPATPESGCHDLLAPPTAPATSPKASSVGASRLIESVYEVSHAAPVHNSVGLHESAESHAHPYELGYNRFARGGVGKAELALAAPVSGCPDATYSLELYDLSKRPVLLDDVRVSGLLAQTDGTGTRVLLSALIDDSDALYTGETNKSCSNARLVVRDAAGAVVDVEPNQGYHHICTGQGGATSYSG